MSRFSFLSNSWSKLQVISSVYRDNASKTFSLKPLLVGQPVIYTSHLDSVRQTMGVNAAWFKPDMAIDDLQ